MGQLQNINFISANQAGAVSIAPKKEYVCAYEDPANETRGNKYNETKDLDIKQIAQLVRKDIKLSMKSGELAGVDKVSVKIERSSMCEVLKIDITGFTGQFFNPLYVAATENFTDYHNDAVYEINRGAGRHSTGMQSALRKLEEIGSAYNRDNSDSMSDYSDVRFFLRVGFDYRVNDAAQEAEKIPF